MPSLLSWGIGRAATLLKTLLQYFGKSSCQVLPTPESGTTGCEKKTKVEDVSIRMYLSKNRICIRHVLYANLNSAKPTKQQMKHIQVLQGVKKNCLLQCSCCDNSGNYLSTFFATVLIKLSCCICNIFSSFAEWIHLVGSSLLVKFIKHNQNYYLKCDVSTSIRGLYQMKLVSKIGRTEYQLLLIFFSYACHEP